jgi:hypothetical protein
VPRRVGEGRKKERKEEWSRGGERRRRSSVRSVRACRRGGGGGGGLTDRRGKREARRARGKSRPDRRAGPTTPAPGGRKLELSPWAPRIPRPDRPGWPTRRGRGFTRSARLGSPFEISQDPFISPPHLLPPLLCAAASSSSSSLSTAPVWLCIYTPPPTATGLVLPPPPFRSVRSVRSFTPHDKAARAEFSRRPHCSAVDPRRRKS